MYMPDSSWAFHTCHNPGWRPRFQLQALAPPVKVQNIKLARTSHESPKHKTSSKCWLWKYIWRLSLWHLDNEYVKVVDALNVVAGADFGDQLRVQEPWKSLFNLLTFQIARRFQQIMNTCGGRPLSWGRCCRGSWRRTLWWASRWPPRSSAKVGWVNMTGRLVEHASRYNCSTFVQHVKHQTWRQMVPQ